MKSARPTQGLSIGRLAKASRVHLETIRYYERVGLIPEPPRTQSGRRLYEAAHLARLVFIRRARELGFSIDEIRALLNLAGPHGRSCHEVRDIAAAHLRDIRSKLGDLRRLEAVLAETLERCDSEPQAPVCPLLQVLEAPAHGASYDAGSR
jgi:MerR family mercuric resistance operon transcriptional regulator